MDIAKPVLFETFSPPLTENPLINKPICDPNFPNPEPMLLFFAVAIN
jgi:hypothetical protein